MAQAAAMKMSLPVRVILGAAATLTGIGQVVSGVSLEVPAPILSANSDCSDWTAWMPRRTHPAIIMQVVTESYIPVQKNFIALMESNSRFSRDNIFLVCLDDESVEAVALMGFDCVPLAGNTSRRFAKVWQLRVKILSCLLEAGYDVIASDSDALWLNDPQLDFDMPEVRGSGIVSSRGDMPSDLYSLWGSTLCMGFVLFRAGAGVENVLAKMKSLVMEISDDQKVINFVLEELGVEWDTTTDMRYIQSTGFGTGTVPVTGLSGADSFNVTLLPHSKYTRRCDEVPIGPKTTVAHCHAAKRGSSKIAWMQRENMWVADDVVEEEHDQSQEALTSKGDHDGSDTQSSYDLSGEN